ncbi:hypothetical protein D9613_005904 [Agrocybe pediades]|uniref:Epoxide hydrolase N-terminal domain-containing protein n=1 Tax=Agrocybe pediades TaxID=84607 RepID=A0A8H4QUV3_9AGAR|nr:hypothetical protein D9613_005904 [Agrocybe pediades]
MASVGSTAEVPYKISVPEEELQLLKQKLELTRLPDELDDAGYEYGAPLADIRRLATRWREGYDWRKHEKELNDELPQFMREIEVKDGFGKLKIHYVHKRSEREDAIPLLFVHGWPGSFIEVRKILPLLVDSGSSELPSSHVVAYSLPGFGFSECSKKKGFALAQHAEVGHKLMLSLGYNEYVTQGGDWGYYITRRIAQDYGGKHSKAWHTNWAGPLPGGPPTLLSSPLLYLQTLLKTPTGREKEETKRTAWFRSKGRGYFAEQSTQPQTLGYSLADSPVGLLAWIYEKLVSWTDDYKWEDDEVLTWISIYWFSTAGPSASCRIYYEKVNERVVSDPTPTIPNGVSFFPKELTNFPRSWTRTRYRVFEADHDSGGHFAAHEKPNELVADLRKMFGKGGRAYGVVNTLAQ